ncbi:hypothetical protein [Vandammella animalimorsus]|uniref:hypothetical protein n=1 Tax=Vandammella animalimorsus TaxID=2029117 RepID=UPI001EEDAAA4|nr:hypothetical protein [Vandammella animalimorsus]
MKKLNFQDLERLQSLIDAGNVGDFYSYLVNRGYRYASWAKGVANGETLAGISALDYMRNSALKGGNGVDCRNLPASTVAKIKIDMTQAYLNVLEDFAQKNPSKLVDRDVGAWRSQHSSATL